MDYEEDPHWGLLTEVQYRKDKKPGSLDGDGALDDVSCPVEIRRLALFELNGERVNVEHGASHVQTDRACQESEQSAKLIPAPGAMFTPERFRCVEYGGVGCRIEPVRSPGQGDDRLHRRVVRGPVAVELRDVDAGPGDRYPRRREDPVDAFMVESRGSIVEKSSPGVRDTVHRDIPGVDERILGGDGRVGKRTDARVEVAGHDGRKGAGRDKRPHQRGRMDASISGSMIEMGVHSPEFVAGNPIAKSGIDKYPRHLVAPGSGAGDVGGIRERGLLPAQQCESATVVEQGTAFAATIGVPPITD